MPVVSVLGYLPKYLSRCLLLLRYSASEGVVPLLYIYGTTPTSLSRQWPLELSSQVPVNCRLGRLKGQELLEESAFVRNARSPGDARGMGLIAGWMMMGLVSMDLVVS